MGATNVSRAVCVRDKRTKHPRVFDLTSIIWKLKKVLGAPTGGLWPLVHVGDAPCLFGLASMRRPASAWGTIRDLQGSFKPIFQGGSVGVGRDCMHMSANDPHHCPSCQINDPYDPSRPFTSTRQLPLLCIMMTRSDLSLLALSLGGCMQSGCPAPVVPG